MKTAHVVKPPHAALASRRRLVAGLAALTVLAGLGHAGSARADLGDSELDTRFSAKIAKERTRVTTQQKMDQRRTGRTGTEDGQATSSQCGSQNIGNVDTGGRIGSQPREVFVYAPNAFNVVTRGGCR